MPRPVTPTTTHASAALRSQLRRSADAGRAELEHLMADVAAEILLLEVALRRNEEELLRTMGPRVRPPDMQAIVARRTELRASLGDLRDLAAEVRSRLQQRG